MATKDVTCWNDVEVGQEKAALRILFRCIVRGIAERHGGTIEKDPETNLTFVGLPPQAESAFFAELGKVLECVPKELAFCKEEPLF